MLALVPCQNFAARWQLISVRTQVRDVDSFDENANFISRTEADGDEIVYEDLDGNHRLSYANHAGQPIASVLRSGEDQWIDFYQYDAQGDQILHAHPSAVIDIDEEAPDLLDFQEESQAFRLLRNTAGFIERTAYDAASRQVSRQRIQNGQFGDLVQLNEYEYTRTIHFRKKSTSPPAILATLAPKTPPSRSAPSGLTRSTTRPLQSRSAKLVYRTSGFPA